MFFLGGFFDSSNFVSSRRVNILSLHMRNGFSVYFPVEFFFIGTKFGPKFWISNFVIFFEKKSFSLKCNKLKKSFYFQVIKFYSTWWSYHYDVAYDTYPSQRQCGQRHNSSHWIPKGAIQFINKWITVMAAMGHIVTWYCFM